MKHIVQFLLKLLERRKKRRSKKGDCPWSGSKPVFTSTPPSFKIYPLNKFQTRFSEAEDDFKIYDDFNNFNNITSSSSGTEERIYENLADLAEREHDEEIFENVIFLNSIELEHLPSEDIYEMIFCQNSNHQTKWKFKPRTLKSNHY